MMAQVGFAAIEAICGAWSDADGPSSCGLGTCQRHNYAVASFLGSYSHRTAAGVAEEEIFESPRAASNFHDEKSTVPKAVKGYRTRGISAFVYHYTSPILSDVFFPNECWTVACVLDQAAVADSPRVPSERKCCCTNCRTLLASRFGTTPEMPSRRKGLARLTLASLAPKRRHARAVG